MRGSSFLSLAALLMATFGAVYAPAVGQEAFPEAEYAAASHEQSYPSGYDVMPAGGEETYAGKPLSEGSPPGAGGNWFDVWSGNCPCDFDSYWDVTGGRSPNEWAGNCGYGYECHTWNFRAEYLLWFSRGRHTPPLVSSFTDIENDQAVNPRTVYGNNPIGENARSGLRLTLGYLLADGRTTVEGRFWGVEDSTERFSRVSSARHPRIGRPYFDVGDNGRTIELIAAPGFSAGFVDVLSKNDLIGGDFWLRRTTYDDGYSRFDLLAGYQFSRMDDTLHMTAASVALAGNTLVTPGFRAAEGDLFRTENEFHGGTIGFLSEHRWKIWSVELLGKLGLGNMREAVEIAGATAGRQGNGPIVVAPGGLYTRPSNIGQYERHRFAVVPELNVNGVCNLSPSCRLHVGYSIIYWSDAVLAGNQIDPRINSEQPVGPSLPAFSFVTSDFVVQGLNLGAEYRW